MRLGPKWGPAALGYGPILLVICGFLLKSRLIDPWIDPGLGTLALFVLFGLMGPLVNIGTRIVTETMQKTRHGQWSASADPHFDRNGPVSPTAHWVEMVRDWTRD
jgi:hypothetical protein